MIPTSTSGVNKPSSQDRVRITVFGPGFGESIVIYIPQIGWGVIDSCEYRKVNPALEYLQKNKAQKISFIVLSHPHLDHYKGLDQLIHSYIGRIDRICYYSGDGLKEYRSYLAKKAVLNEPGIKTLGRLLRLFEKAQKKGARIVRISERTEIIRKRQVDGHDIEVLALSPSAQSVARYVELLYAAIPKNIGDYTRELQKTNYNLLSTALWCQIGKLRFIFGSDLEIGDEDQMGWKGIVTNIDTPELSIDFVKVPHHGSPNAFYQPVWEKFSEGGKIISVITPYNRLSEPLPNSDILKKIFDYSSVTAVTAKIKTTKPERIYNRDAVRNFHGVKKWRYIVKPKQIGCVEVNFRLGADAISNTKIEKPSYLWEA